MSLLETLGSFFGDVQEGLAGGGDADVRVVLSNAVKKAQETQEASKRTVFPDPEPASFKKWHGWTKEMLRGGTDARYNPQEEMKPYLKRYSSLSNSALPEVPPLDEEHVRVLKKSAREFHPTASEYEAQLRLISTNFMLALKPLFYAGGLLSDYFVHLDQVEKAGGQEVGGAPEVHTDLRDFALRAIRDAVYVASCELRRISSVRGSFVFKCQYNGAKMADYIIQSNAPKTKDVVPDKKGANRELKKIELFELAHDAKKESSPLLGELLLPPIEIDWKSLQAAQTPKKKKKAKEKNKSSDGDKDTNKGSKYKVPTEFLKSIPHGPNEEKRLKQVTDKERALMDRFRLRNLEPWTAKQSSFKARRARNPNELRYRATLFVPEFIFLSVNSESNTPLHAYQLALRRLRKKVDNMQIPDESTWGNNRYSDSDGVSTGTDSACRVS